MSVLTMVILFRVWVKRLSRALSVLDCDWSFEDVLLEVLTFLAMGVSLKQVVYYSASDQFRLQRRINHFLVLMSMGS